MGHFSGASTFDSVYPKRPGTFTVAGVILTVTLILLAVLALLGFGYIGFSNTATRFEVNIKAKYTDNKNVYDNGFKKVVELAQVPDMERDNLLKLYQGAMTGRYGQQGSQALFQFINEQNPHVTGQLYTQIQETIRAFREEFQSNQTRLVSLKQEYETFLTATTSGWIYNTIGHYPRIDLSQFDIVTSDKTEDDFRTKRAEPLKLGNH